MKGDKVVGVTLIYCIAESRVAGLTPTQIIAAHESARRRKVRK
jgi:hypothetical protein